VAGFLDVQFNSKRRNQMKRSMKNIVTIALSGLALVVIAEGANAGPRNNRIERTEVRQHERIQEGVKSGELTPEEAKKLREEQREINKKRRADRRNDGKIDASEMKDLRQDQKNASKDIYQEKHDAEKR
jgi:hypothetical protein